MTGSLTPAWPEESKILAFCIPTYRRPDLLTLCIQSIVRSGGSFGVSIYVSDDSGDQTNDAALAQLKRWYPYIHVFKNKTNIGIDANILAATDLCGCEYAWLIGEDDLVVPDAISRILQTIKLSRPRFIAVNYSYVSNDYQYCLRERVMPLAKDINLNGEDFMASLGWAIGFIGACVIQRNQWHAARDFVGTFYAHVASIYRQIHGHRISVIAEPLILNRAENTRSFTWGGRAFDVFFGWERMLSMLGAEYAGFDVERAKQSSQVLFRHRSLGWLVSKRADGVYTGPVYEVYIRPICDSALKRTAAMMISRCPIFICRGIKFIAVELPRLLKKRRISSDRLPADARI